MVSRKLRCFLTAAMILLCTNVNAQNSLLAQARAINETNYEESLKLYDQVLQNDPSNYEAIWNVSFLESKIGNRETNKKVKEVHFKKALSLAEKALEMNPNSVYSYYVYGVALGRMGDISGAKERVQNATKIKEKVEYGLKIDSTHAASWHLLGRLHYRLDNLNMAEKAAAAILFGGLPKGVSTEEAVNAYSAAGRHRPNYILYKLDLAVALIRLGKKNEARDVLNAAIKIPPYTEDDPSHLEDCKSLLKKLK